jgi:hypothetical protein
MVRLPQKPTKYKVGPNVMKKLRGKQKCHRQLRNTFRLDYNVVSECFPRTQPNYNLSNHSFAKGHTRTLNQIGRKDECR